MLYNNNQTTLINWEMQKDDSIFREVTEYLCQESFKIVTEKEGFQEVEQFLCDSAFLDYGTSIISSKNIKDGTEQEKPQTNWEQSQNQIPSRKVSKNSLFHNFQKHLIAILKKLINISKDSLNDQESQDLIVELWNAFLKTKSHSKKIFHIIFGVPEENRVNQELQRLARMFKQFNKVKENYNIDSIIEAQEVLRKKVVQRLQSCEKSEIMKKTHVHKIDEFYEYLKSFVFELTEGPATKRMTKVRKTTVIKELKKQKSIQ